MYPGLVCQIHTGYMQDTCRIHAQRTYLLAACQIHVDTCKTWKIQGSSVYLGTADKIHAGYMQDTCRIHAGYMQDTCGIRGSSVYLGTAVQIRSRYAGYVLKRCRICAGTGCVDVSRVGLEIWRQGGMRWRTNQASMYFILCVRYTQDTLKIHQDTSQYMKHNVSLSQATRYENKYVSEYVRIR